MTLENIRVVVYFEEDQRNIPENTRDNELYFESKIGATPREAIPILVDIKHQYSKYIEDIADKEKLDEILENIQKGVEDELLECSDSLKSIYEMLKRDTTDEILDKVLIYDRSTDGYMISCQFIAQLYQKIMDQMGPEYRSIYDLPNIVAFVKEKEDGLHSDEKALTRINELAKIKQLINNNDKYGIYVPARTFEEALKTIQEIYEKYLEMYNDGEKET